MRSLDLVEQEKAQAEAGAQTQEQERQQFQQTLGVAAKGEHLTEDFETVASDAGRTFSQDEVNGFIRDRLAKERAKYGTSTVAMAEKLTGYETTLTEREKQLAAAEHRFSAKSELYNRGLNTDDDTLNLVMSASVEETMKKIDKLYYTLNPEKGRVTHVKNSYRQRESKDVLRQVMGLQDPK